MHARAGQPAQPEDLVDVTALLEAYDAITPDVTDPPRRSCSVRRASRLQPGRRVQRHPHPGDHPGDLRVPHSAGTTGPLLIGRDSHALSEPAWRTALEVLAGNDVQVLVDSADRLTPTPAVSHAILRLNRGGSGAGRTASW